MRGGGSEQDAAGTWRVGPGWHLVTIGISDKGTQAWYDGTPLPFRHPTLTHCTELQFRIDQDFAGTVCWDVGDCY
jgi:hypothetical protein